MARDRIRWIAVIALAAGACGRRAAPSPVPAAAPATVSVAAPESNALPYSVDPITECVLRKGRLQDVEIAISAAGDTTYEGQPFSRAFPTDSTYAEHASWYATSTLADVDGQPYLKYGQPRVLASTDVVPYVPVSGVMSFREPGSRIFHPLVIYVPVRPGCIFEPYIWFGPK